MARTPRRSVSFWLLAVALGTLAAAEPPPAAAVAAPAGGDAVNANPYAAAMAEAEADLARLEETPENGGGWSVGDAVGVVALLAALGLMVWTARWTRNLSPFRGPKGREMELLDRMAVGRQSTLLVVRLRGRDYWLADHPHGVTLLAELPAAADKQGPDTTESPFPNGIPGSEASGPSPSAAVNDGKTARKPAANKGEDKMVRG